MIEQMMLLSKKFFAQPELFYAITTIFPFIFFLELPLYILILLSSLYSSFSAIDLPRCQNAFYPKISCILSGYNEGDSIKISLHSLYEQIYPGILEILVIIDGATVNHHTYNAVRNFMQQHPNTCKRIIRLIAKTTRGGHASSINLGIKLARSDYVLVLDGDSSCDNDMLSIAITNFKDPDVVGMSGMIRVRDPEKNLLTTLQAIEYILGIHVARSGLSTLKCLNIISSAFGVFRRDFLMRIGGWKNGAAEDLDLTIRMQAYFKRYPNLKIIHDSRAVVHTEVPTTPNRLFKQRWRWEGDLFYIYVRRHWRVLRPRYLGWPTFIMIFWSSLLLQLTMPLVILLYFIYLVFNYLDSMGSLLLLAYLFYLTLNTAIFSFYLLLGSERKSRDFNFFWFIPLMPIYQFMMRIWAGIALIYEIIFKTHRGTTMAPWWILRKSD